jgi:virginiamycin B lyase
MMALLSMVATSIVVAQPPTVTFTRYSLPSLGRGIATGPDGALWFTEYSTHRIGRITTAGAIAEYGTSGNPSSIVAGPDGALWFTEDSANLIGRITTSGVITEYSIPCCGIPLSIAAGPDGALWFTEAGSNRIGHITTAGVVTEFSLPNPDARSAGIAAGPDGSLWFTEPVEYTDTDGFVVCLGTQTIGRITTIGVVTEYALPYMGISTWAACGDVGSIVAGPDGALWFNTAGNTAIGRITTDGVFTEHPIPGGHPYRVSTYITAGPDGALWFPVFSNNGPRGAVILGRITTAGIITQYITQYSVPFGTGNSQITNGPDGALWFTVSGSIVRAAVGSGATIATASLPCDIIGSNTPPL